MPDISAYENMYKTGEWNCFMCSKWFARRSYLQQHLLVHYKLDIKNQYISDVHMTKCPLCDFEGKDLKSLISHIAVKPHYKLKEYIPGKYSFFCETNFTKLISRKNCIYDFNCSDLAFIQSKVFLK